MWKRQFSSYAIKDYSIFKRQVLQYLEHCSTFCFLDNHGYQFNSTYECLTAIGKLQSVSPRDFSGVDQLHRQTGDWIFGHVSYDYKNTLHGLQSSHPDEIGFEDLHFFVPRAVLILEPGRVRIGMHEPRQADRLFEQISALRLKEETPAEPARFQSRFSREDYLQTVKDLKAHIYRGDCYEINFCQEFFAHHNIYDPLAVYQKLCGISPAPFSACYRMGDRYLLSASPERFIRRSGEVLVAQPMKGTAARVPGDPLADSQSREALLQCGKERAENTMIVDLVRNDLSKVCTEGSVQVTAFLEVHSFPQVHQMISTVEGRLPGGTPVGAVMEATFPMGSMTGAPKRRVMELIERYERTRRGLFSGSVGYIDPQGNFDFNVVIRSILYHSARKYVSIQCGSAITAGSDPQKEYEECLLKAEALIRALS